MDCPSLVKVYVIANSESARIKDIQPKAILGSRHHKDLSNNAPFRVRHA